NYDPRHVCFNPFPDIDIGNTGGIYLAGSLICLIFAPAALLFLDACILLAHANALWGHTISPLACTSPSRRLPGLYSLLDFLIINLINNKDRVCGDKTAFGDAPAMWHARLFLFIEFALMAGGMAGSVIRTLLLFKYIIPAHVERFKYYGYASISQDLALMLSVVILWTAQNQSGEYEYYLTIRGSVSRDLETGTLSSEDSFVVISLLFIPTDMQGVQRMLSSFLLCPGHHHPRAKLTVFLCLDYNVSSFCRAAAP
ncbi:hypothetical protein B0H13DRAFT_1604997, partial [Mycena leptocephala]